MEVHVEQEEESEQEQELELETQQEQEQVKAEQRPLGNYPPRMLNRNKLTHGVAEKIHPAYHPLITVTDNFLPFSRVGKKALYQRRPFDENMYRIGEIYLQTDYKYNITQLIIEDPLRDFFIPRDGAYDIRTNQFITLKGFKDNISYSQEFIELIAQVKFLDGRFSGYSPEELKALSTWLTKHHPEQMQDHFLNEILCYRYQDKQAFVGSQLHQLFETLNKSN